MTSSGRRPPFPPFPRLLGVPQIGRVASFDSAGGLGTVVAGGAQYRFHCTAIADGSREIEPGTLVAFVVVAGLGGVLEGRSVTAVVGQQSESPASSLSSESASGVGDG